MKKIRQTYDRVLEAIAVFLIVAVTVIVTGAGVLLQAFGGH